MDRFWMIYMDAGHPPTFKHDTKQSALDEAKRLALNFPSRNIYILEALVLVKNNQITIEKLKTGSFVKDCSDIPF